MAPRAAALVPLAVLALVLSGCTGSAPKSEAPPSSSAPTATVSEDTGSISGTVVDEEMLPIQGAQVGIKGATTQATTDASGKFTFNDLAPDNYTILAQRFGFDAGSARALVKAGEVTTARLTLRLQAVAAEQRTVTVPKSALIVFGEAYFQYATQASNISGVHQTFCTGCDNIIYFEPKPKEIATEAAWDCTGCNAVVNDHIWLLVLSKWGTGDATDLDADETINDYLSNREKLMWTDGQVKEVVDTKTNKFLLRVGGGTVVPPTINLQQRVNLYQSFSYNGPFEDDFTALPKS